MARDEINAFLGTGTDFNGVLNFKGSVRMDGVYKGEVQSDGILIAGKESKLSGKFHVGEFNLAGNFEGEIKATRKITIFKGGVLKGSIQSPKLVVEDGAILEGNINMTNPQEEVITQNIED